MNFDDFIVVDTWLYTTMNLFYRNYELAREGIFEYQDWQKAIDVNATWWLGSRFGRTWWKEEARYFFAPEFVAYVDQHLEKATRVDAQAYWLKIKSRLIRK